MQRKNKIYKLFIFIYIYEFCNGTEIKAFI